MHIMHYLSLLLWFIFVSWNCEMLAFNYWISGLLGFLKTDTEQACIVENNEPQIDDR